MYLECRHIKSNGSKCHSPAMKDKPYCYYHLRAHRILHKASAISRYEHKDLQIPFLEDRGAVQIALSEVVSALATNHIDFKRAALMIYALQVASSNAKIPADLVALHQVREHSENEEGDELAPEITTYEPDDEEYQEANHEPTLTEILMAEVRRHRQEEEDEARQSAERHQHT